LIIKGALSTPKRFVPVSDSILREAMRISERSGVPVRDLVEKILATVVGYMRYRPDLLEAIHMLDALEDLRRIGCVMLPQSTVKKILETMPESDFREIVEELGKAAAWYGVVAKAKRGANIDDIQVALQIWLPNIDIHITRIENNPGKFKLVVSPPLNISSERLSTILETIVKNIVASMGGSISSISNSSGVISMVISIAE
jgi:hypothetical protein